MENTNQRSYVVIYLKPLQRLGSTITKWRPVISYLTPNQIYQEHLDQFGAGIVDIVEVTDPKNPHSVFNQA